MRINSPELIEMKRVFVLLLYCLMMNSVSSQEVAPSTFGYRHFQIDFNDEKVDILVRSKAGEENVKKPVIFYVQGSTARPLIVHNGKQLTSLTMIEGFVEDKYHLVLVNKPGLPLMVRYENFDRSYKDPKTGKRPEEYRAKNNLEYYVERNSQVVEFIKEQAWFDPKVFVAAGHSEGSTIVTHMVDKIPGFTHMIYSGGLPYFSRILAMVAKDRLSENRDNKSYVPAVFDYWKDVLDHPFDLDRNQGWNTNRGTYSFSQNENDVLKRLNIPILICYGTLDEASPYNDMFRIEVMSERKKNFTFKAYLGCDHYYQSEVEGDQLEIVMKDWLAWIDE